MAKFARITPGIGIQNSVTDKYWVFHNWEGTIDIAPGDRVFIASSQDGMDDIICDNSIFVNGHEHGNTFGGTTVDPKQNIGRTAGTAYLGVSPIEVTNDRRADGHWYIQLVDFGYTYAASALYIVARP